MSGAATDPIALLHVHEVDGEREVELFNHGAGCLTDADKAAGWTETRLYAAPSPAGNDVGRVSVPRVPTAAMYEAAFDSDLWGGKSPIRRQVDEIWSAMLRAAALSDTSPTEGEGA